MNTEFFRPDSLSEAVTILARYNGSAVVVNGGTDIVIDIINGKVQPAAIVYIQKIPELQNISHRDGRISLGGAVTFRDMQRSPFCRQVAGLMASLRALGSPAIRAVATPAGNVCNAAPSADCSTMLTALEAQIVLISQNVERTVPLKDFFISAYQTVRQKDEIIREINFAAPGKGSGTGYYRVSQRKAQDIGHALVGVFLQLENGVCARASISLGALNATIVRSHSIERAIVGKTREEALSFTRATFPIETNLLEDYFKRYKELVVPAVLTRAIAMAWDDAERRV